MRILILNWRDLKNPESGGAEILTHEMAKRWVAMGHTVTQFSSRFDKARNKETIDGVHIVRYGSARISMFRLSVHIASFFWLIGKYSRFDIILDEVHGIPFFTPLYTKKTKVLLICEVADNIWDILFPFPFNTIGKAIERNYLKLYKSSPILTISDSTKKDIAALGVKKDRITVLPMGFSVPARLTKYKKEKRHTLLFVGRMSKAKGIEDAISVVEKLISFDPNIMLWIIGRKKPEYYQNLKESIILKGLEKNIIFFGFVSERKKFELMARANLLIVPSQREGFGLIVPEAGYVNTPSIVYNVEGLRDVVAHNKNGLIVNPNPHDMAQMVTRVFTSYQLYKRLTRNAKIYSSKYSWDKTAETAQNILDAHINTS